ncbi:MAG: alpha/beta hydrolase [Micromonosporaceae bacterium]
MLGPQSYVIFGLLLAIFVAGTYLQRRAGHLAVQIGAAAMSFIVAALFGMAVVNKFYDYYQTWGNIVADLTGTQPGVTALPKVPPPGKLQQVIGGSDAAKNGRLISLDLTGSKSGISRPGLVFLPPQYFQSHYANYRFAVIELLHGSPGRPYDWVGALHVTTALDALVSRHHARPMVLVMPDVNGGVQLPSSQCLNEATGPQTDTYLSVDVPADVTASFRVQPMGRHWGIAGYSEGGFCAANLALRHPSHYAVAASMSGYFQPLPIDGVDPFAGNASARLANDPMWLAERHVAGQPMPAFWLMAGLSDRADVLDVRTMAALLRRWEPVPTIFVPRVQHTFAAWIPAVPRMLAWMSPRLTAGLLLPTSAPSPASTTRSAPGR